MSLMLMVLVLIVVVVGISAAFGSLRKFQWGHANLNCPHCDAETPANQKTCQQCGHEL